MLNLFIVVFRNEIFSVIYFIFQALLAGSDHIKFGYVSRAMVRDSSRHVILGTQQYKPSEVAAQINLSMDNAWGILRCIVDICLKQKDGNFRLILSSKNFFYFFFANSIFFFSFLGKYLIMKDPNKPIIRLYDIPDNTFESDGTEDSGDEGPDTFGPSYNGNNLNQNNASYAMKRL